MTAEKLATTIEQLDELLLDGFSLFEIAERELDKLEVQNKDPELADALERFKIQHREWHNKVYEFLSEQTDRNYYLVHFVRYKPLYVSMGSVDGFTVHFESQINEVQKILQMLEERYSLARRQEIAQQEHDSSHRYWLRYNDVAGRLYLNGNILLATTRLDSPADRLLQQCFANPENLIEIENIKGAQISSLLRDLNIKGSLKKIFFPRTSGKKVFFRPFITNAEFAKEDHKDVGMADFMRNNEKQ